MRIRNEGKRTFFFNGGKIAPGEVVDIRDEAIAKALLKCYPNELICLDNLEVRVVESKKTAPAKEPASVEKAEPVVEEEEKPASKKSGKRKKA